MRRRRGKEGFLGGGRGGGGEKVGGVEEEAGREVSSGRPSLMVFLTKERQHQEQKQEAKRHGRAMATHRMSRSKGGYQKWRFFLIFGHLFFI